MSRRSPAVSAGRDVLAVLGTFVVLGAVCGVVWWRLVDPAVFKVTPDGGLEMSEVQLSRRFDADGWYSVIAIVAGSLSGLVVTWWRSRDFRLTTFLLVPGSVLAATVMTVVGRTLGPADPRVALVGASTGQSVPLPLEVTGFAVYLLWPVAVLFGALMVLWSTPRLPAVDELGREPGNPSPAPSLPSQSHERAGPTTP